MSLNKELILFGAGGHAKSCIDVIEQANIYKVKGLVGLPTERGRLFFDYAVIASDDEIGSLSEKFSNAFISVGQIGSPDLRAGLYKKVRAFNFFLPVIISPHAIVSKYATIGAGTIIMHGAVVNAGAVIGENCIINTHSIVEHDAVVGDHCHVSTRSTLNGAVNVGAGSFIGSGAVVREGLVIPVRSFIKMGSIVIKTPDSEINIGSKPNYG